MPRDNILGHGTTWTPGPWAVHPDMAWVVPEAAIHIPICQLRRSTNGVPADERSTKADAHLIAAAPEMFAALLEARDWIKLTVGGNDLTDRMDAALARAQVQA